MSLTPTNVSIQIKIYKYLLSSAGTYRGHGGHSRRETNVGHGAACVSPPAQAGLEGAVTVCLVINFKKRRQLIRCINEATAQMPNKHGESDLPRPAGEEAPTRWFSSAWIWIASRLVMERRLGGGK